MDKSEILDNLISNGEKLANTISYVPARPGVIRTFSVYKTSDSEKYQDWQSTVLRFIKTNFPSDYDDMKEATDGISPKKHQKIIGILRAIKLLPEEPKENVKNKGASTNVTINNTQNVVLNLFVEAIKDEISGKDYKALKEILKNYEKEPEKSKSKLTDKLKSFGSDILTNIIANILTNPNVYTGLF